MQNGQSKPDKSKSSRRRATGPRTEQGKAKASRNSFKHGLNVRDPSLEEAAKKLATAIVGFNAKENIQALAEDAAVAALEAVRADAYRIGSLQQAVSQSTSKELPLKEMCSHMKPLLALERYVRRARTRRNKAFQRLDDALSQSHRSDLA